jgi:hypothetical protein
MANLNIAPLSSVRIFRFSYHDELHEAAFYEDQMLKLAGRFVSDDRQDAIALAHHLSQKHYTLLTANANLYKIWVDRRCQVPLHDAALSFRSA